MAYYTEDYVDSHYDQVLEKTIRQQLEKVEAEYRFGANESAGTYYVYGVSKDGVSLIYDEDGVPKVSEKIVLGSFPTKAEALTFLTAVSDAVEAGTYDSSSWLSQFASGIDSVFGDTLTPGASSLDSALSDYGNATLLENFLTEINPNLNVNDALEAVCEMILDDDFTISDWEKVKTRVKKEVRKIIRKIIKQIVKNIINALNNISQRLRNMVVDKINDFLAQYVASECVVGLSEALSDFANPKNLLSANELSEDIGAILTETDEAIGKLLSEIEDSVKLMVDTADDIWTATFGNAEKNPNVKKLRAKARKNLQEIMVELLCSRTKAYQDKAQKGLTKSIHKQITDYMNSCLFKQALKNMKDFAPDSITAEALDKINNLAQQGSYLDAYNIALACGVNLTTDQFQVQLPSQLGWISDVYGDPYMFAPQSPNNSDQVAEWLTDGLPTFSEMYSGNIPSEKLSNPYVAKNWSSEDAAGVTTQNLLAEKTSIKTERIEYSQSIGNSFTYTYSDRQEIMDQGGLGSGQFVQGNTTTVVKYGPSGLEKTSEFLTA